MAELPPASICFHGIGSPQRDLEPGEADYWISTGQFELILDEISNWPEVNISFDDGNASDIEIGLDALLQRGLTATFFVLAGRLGTKGSLGPDAVRELRRVGMTIGTHGMNHRPWRGMDAATRDRELVDARVTIAEVSGGPIDEAALPLGRYDRRLLADLRRLGYKNVHTSDRRCARPGSWLQPRFSVHADDTGPKVRASVLASRAPLHRLKLGAVGVIKQVR